MSTPPETGFNDAEEIHLTKSLGSSHRTDVTMRYLFTAWKARVAQLGCRWGCVTGWSVLLRPQVRTVYSLVRYLDRAGGWPERKAVPFCFCVETRRSFRTRTLSCTVQSISSTAVQTLHSSTRLFVVSLSSHPHFYLYASFVGRLTVHHFLCIASQSEKYPALNRSTIVTQYGLTGPLKSRPIRFASGERVPNFRTPVGRLVSQSNKQAISRPAESSQRFPRNTRATKPSSSRSFLSTLGTFIL